MQDRERARIAEKRYREKHLAIVRARQAEHKRNKRASNPDAIRAYQRLHYAKNRERINARSRLKYAANPEYAREYSRQYRDANPEYTRAIVRNWRTANPDKAKEIGKRWHDANLDKVRMHRKTRRARLAGAIINDFTISQWQAIQAAFKHRCAYCLKLCKGKLTQDHILPLSKGGHHTASNIVPACKSCNSKKHTSPPLIPVQPLLFA